MKTTRTAPIVAGLLVLAAAIPGTLAMASSGSLTDCSRSQLGVRSNGTNGAAGTIHGAWVFTNVSSAKCKLEGYPGVQLYGTRGRPIPLTVKDNLSPAPSAVALPPGSSGTFFSSYSDVPPGPQGCPASSVIQITAPNASGSLFIPAQLGPCRNILNVSAVEAGVHAP
jgi:hypothetical protein